jgi:hypothetical protein
MGIVVKSLGEGKPTDCASARVPAPKTRAKENKRVNKRIEIANMVIPFND